MNPASFVVVRVGDGAAALTNASTAAFLEKRDLMGAMIGTPIALPTVAAGGQRALTLSGTATSEGSIALSVDGHYATFAGYDVAPGTGAVNTTAVATVNRVVARLDAMGNVDTATVLNTAFNASNVRSAVSTDGISIWVSGNSSTTGGVHYTMLGSTGSTQILAAPANVRWINVFGGQLYASSGSQNFTQVFSVGTGTPNTAGQTATVTPGLPTASASPYGFAFFDLNANVAGLDTLYVGDDSSVANGGGIQKWTFDGTTWTKAATFAPPDAAGVAQVGVRAIAAFKTAGAVTLIAVTSDSGANRVVSAVDDGIAVPTFTVLASAATNTAFRGVAISPQ